MKKQRNTSAQPPLTPDIVTSGSYIFEPPLTRTEVQELYRKIASLKTELAAERKRHLMLENALNRYLVGIERELQERTEAITVLARELASQLGNQMVQKGTR